MYIVHYSSTHCSITIYNILYCNIYIYIYIYNIYIIYINSLLIYVVYVPFKLLKASSLHIVSRCLCAVWAQEAAKCEVGPHCTSRTAFCIGTLRPGLIGFGSSSGSQKSNMSYEVILRWQKQGRSAEWCYPLRVQSVRWSMSWDVVSLSSQLLTPLFIRLQSCPEVHFCPYSNLVFTTAICSNMVLTCFNLIQFLPLCNSVLSDKELWSMC